MSAGAQHLNNSVVERVTRARKPLELPPAPAIPASVTEHAAELLPVK